MVMLTNFWIVVSSLILFVSVTFAAKEVRWDSNNPKKDISISNALRLLPISFPTARADLVQKKIGSIYADNIATTQTCVVYKLAMKLNTVSSYLAKLMRLRSDTFLCVVVDMSRQEDTKVIYISKPLPSQLEATNRAETFAREYVLWNESATDFETLLEDNTNQSLKSLLAKTLVRRQLLETQLTAYFDETDTFPPKLEGHINHFLNLGEKTLDDWSKFSDTLRKALSEAEDTASRLKQNLPLTFVRSSDLVTTDGSIQKLQWFQFNSGIKKIQCVAHTTTNSPNPIQRELEITHFFEDEEKFFVQPINIMMNVNTYRTEGIPLYWHTESNVMKVIAAKKFYEDAQLNLTKIKAIMRRMQLKGYLDEPDYYVLDDKEVQIASRLNPVTRNKLVGLYLKATIADDSSCYVFCRVEISVGEEQGLIFSMPEGATLYNTVGAVKDAMEALMW